MMKLGTPVYLMSLSWCISPIIGFLLVPLLGSMSDNCRSSLGRRRPFIIGLSGCILVGAIILAVVPDSYNISNAFAGNATNNGGPILYNNSTRKRRYQRIGSTPGAVLLFTCLGVALLDSCCDGCQSPARAFLLDVVPAVDHSAGLTTFTVLAGCGGFFGYLIGSLDWESASGGGGDSSFYHEKVVFILLAVVFTACMVTTVTSFREVPLQERDGEEPARTAGGFVDSALHTEATIGASVPTQNHRIRRTDSIAEQLPSEIGLKTYLMSIVHMPASMRLLCLTNLLCWMSLVSYSLFFTDFVGQAVYHGDPDSPPWSPEHKLYNAGVRMGSLAMSVYSLVCCVYSLVIDRLINKFGIRRIYTCGLLCSSVGALLMGLLPKTPVVLLCSANIGVLYSTLFTVPYILVASYHFSDLFAYTDGPSTESRIRGLGTDIALVSSMVFVGQLTVASLMGSLTQATGSVRTSCFVSSICSFLAAISCRFVTVLESDPSAAGLPQPPPPPPMTQLPDDSVFEGKETIEEQLSDSK